MYFGSDSSQVFIFLRTPSPGPEISLVNASNTPQQLWEELVLLKLTRVTCLIAALGTSQEPSVIAGQFLDFMICWVRMIKPDWQTGEGSRHQTADSLSISQSLWFT